MATSRHQAAEVGRVYRMSNLLVWYAPQIFELTAAMLLTLAVWRSLWYIVGKLSNNL